MAYGSQVECPSTTTAHALPPAGSVMEKERFSGSAATRTLITSDITTIEIEMRRTFLLRCRTAVKHLLSIQINKKACVTRIASVKKGSVGAS